MNLTSQNVQSIILDCLPADGELTATQQEILKSGQPVDGYTIADGIMNSFVFANSKLEANRIKITELLAELPDDFMQSKGGGMSSREVTASDFEQRQLAEAEEIEQARAEGRY